MINSIMSKASSSRRGSEGGGSSIFSVLGSRRGSINQKYLYKDCDNFIREYDEDLQPSPSDQFKFISQHDKEKLYGGDECYLISSEWLANWLAFVKGEKTTIGHISNHGLVEQNEYGSYRLKPGVKVKTDFRPVNKAVWEYYFIAFGGGPVIAFHVPTGFDPKLYKNGKWIENPDLKLHRLVSIIMPDGSNDVSLSLSQPVDVTMLVSGTLCGLAAQNLVKDLGQIKMQQGMAMQAAVSEAQLKSIGQLLSTNSSVGKQMVAKAKNIIRMAQEEADSDEEEGGGINCIHLAATQQMLEEGSALILQHMWVIYRSRKLSTQLRAQQAMLLEAGAVMKLQSFWRIRIAKKKYHTAKEKVKEAKGSVILQRTVRAFICRRRVRNMIRQLHPHNYIIHLKRGTNMNEGDSIIQDPYVVVTAYNIASRGKPLLKAAELSPGLHGAKAVRRGSVLETRKEGKMNLLCYYKTAAPPGSTSPVWNEHTFVTGCGWNAQLVLTYFDANKLGPDTCLGQNVIELKDYPRLYTGETIHFDDFPIKNYSVPVRDPQEQLLVQPGQKARKGRGTVSFSLRLPPVTESMCGWILRASSAFMTSGQFKRRWMILVDKHLHCFEDPYTLNARKGVIDLMQVTSAVKNHADSVTLNTKNDSWLIKWDSSEAKNIQDIWKRKFLRSLPPHIAAALT